MSLTGSVKDGRIKADDTKLMRRIIGAFEGRRVEVNFKEWREKRSNAQNKWEWGVAIPLIAEHCGYDAHEHEALHYELSKLYFGKRVNEATGFETPVGRTSKLSTQEYSDWMEWLARWAATELGVEIPMPSERGDERKTA